MSSMEHPEWVSVGRQVEVVRRLGRSVAHRYVGTVERHTATSVVVDGVRFRAKWGGYHAVPKYIDYITELRPVEVES